MNESDIRRNVRLYRIYAMFAEPLFWGPVVILSLQKLGKMSLPEIYYMESVVLCISLLLDIPSGALADVIGRRMTIVIGRVFLAGSVFFFTFMKSPLEAWIGNILWAIGFTMQSGADTAFLYDTLAERGKEGDYKRIEGQAVGMRLLAAAFCSIATGFLADIDLRLPLYLNAPLALIPLAVSFFWKEPVRAERYSIQKQIDTLRQGGRFILRSKEVRWMVGFSALMATTSKLWFFTYNPYFELVGIKVSNFGIIFFFLNVVAWLSSRFAYRVENYIGERKSVIGIILCVGVPIVIMGAMPIWPFAGLILVQNLVRGFMRPFVGDYMNRHLRTDVRATVLSAQSSASNLVAILGLAGFGFFVATFTLPNSLLALGLGCLAIGALSYKAYTRMISGSG